MAPYHILIATISLCNKQFHRHFGLKKCLILCTFGHMIFTSGQNGGKFNFHSKNQFNRKNLRWQHITY